MIDRVSAPCPSSDQLADCLEPLAPDDLEINSHLEECESCRQMLETLAGEERCWKDARETLLAPQHQAGTQIVASLCAMSIGSNATADSLQEHEVEHLKSLLQPACHPELLGRIGRYELEQLVGRGGMGLVFRARDVELHRVVAVKTLAVHLIPNGTARARFVREARACASLVHPHIVPVHDVITQGPVPALVMQYVAGPTLELRLAERGPLSWREALRIGVQLSDALAAAHEQGLVHRDIKPANVLLEADGSRALLTDFGLVRTLDDASLTRSGMLAGTPDYMSPEQARGETAEQSSDLFSFGSLFYAMLTGNPPFRASGPMAVMNRICHHPHRPLAQLQPDTPVEVARLVDKLLSKQPHRRFASATELRERLQQLARAKSHLTVQGNRARKILMWATISVLLFFGSLAAFHTLGWWGSFDSPRVEVRKIESEPTGAQKASLNSDNDSAAGGFVELQELDRHLIDARGMVKRIQNAHTRPTPEQVLNGKPLLQDLQHELRSIESEIEGLEAEMSRRL